MVLFIILLRQEKQSFKLASLICIRILSKNSFYLYW